LFFDTYAQSQEGKATLDRLGPNDLGNFSAYADALLTRCTAIACKKASQSTPVQADIDRVWELYSKHLNEGGYTRDPCPPFFDLKPVVMPAPASASGRYTLNQFVSTYSPSYIAAYYYSGRDCTAVNPLGGEHRKARKLYMCYVFLRYVEDALSESFTDWPDQAVIDTIWGNFKWYLDTKDFNFWAGLTEGTLPQSKVESHSSLEDFLKPKTVSVKGIPDGPRLLPEPFVCDPDDPHATAFNEAYCSYFWDHYHKSPGPTALRIYARDSEEASNSVVDYMDRMFSLLSIVTCTPKELCNPTQECLDRL
jgi:hypothetical protein